MPDIIKRPFLTDERVRIGLTSEEGIAPAENYEQNVEIKARQLLDDAQKKAEEIIANALLKSKEIGDRAEKEGYSKGLEIAKEEWNAKFSSLEGLITSIKKKIDLSIEGLSNSLLALSIATVKEILMSEVDNADISKKIEKALEFIKTSKHIVIHIPKGVDQGIIDTMKNQEGIEIITESNFGRGDLEIESDFGTLDVRLDTQIKLFEELVKKSFGSK